MYIEQDKGPYELKIASYYQFLIKKQHQQSMLPSL